MSEGTVAFNAQEEIEMLQANLLEKEAEIAALQERMAVIFRVVVQMDEFLKAMLQGGHFEATIQKLQGGAEKPTPIILPS